MTHCRWRSRAGTLAAAFALASGALAGCDQLLGAEKRIERAQERFEAGDAAAAMAHVKSALESAPEDARGRVLLARISLRLGDPDAARKELDRALAAGADPAALRDLHYAILIAQGRFKQALEDAQADTRFDKLRRLVVMSIAHMALGQHEEARRSIEEALALAPADREARLMQARLLWSAGKLKESGEAFDRLVASEPQFARAQLYRGGLAMAVGDAKRAAEAFDQASKLGEQQLDVPEQLTAVVGQVGSRLALGDVAAAEQALQALKQRAPDAFQTRYLEGRIAFAKRDFTAAVQHLQRSLAVQPDHPAARLILGAALIEQGALEQAGSELTVLVEDFPENIEARKLLARVYALRNDPAGAQRVLDEAPAGAIRDSGFDWLSGSIHLLSGQTEEAIALLEQSAAADARNVPLRLDLARAYLLAGRRDQALTLLRSLPGSEGGAARQQLLVLAEVAGKSPQEARQAIERLLKEQPKDVDLLVIAGRYLRGSGYSQEAEDLFRKAIAADARNIEARLGLAASALQRGDRAAAEEPLRKVIELDAANERAYIGLAGAALLGKDRPAARQWLEKAIGANPAAVLARLQLAELAWLDQDPVRARSMIDQALSVTRNRPATLNAVGQILQRASQHDDALQRFNEAAALGFRDAELNAAGAMLALGRQNEARARLESSAAAHPDWLAPTALLVTLDIREKRFEPALARIAAFEKAGGAAATVDELRGQVYFVSGRYAEAAAAYERAARARPTGALAIKVYAARRASRRPDAETSLREWLATHPRDPMVTVALADHYLEVGNRAAAITQYESVLELVQSPKVLNNLAWLYHETKDPRALALARRAHETAPRSAEIADTYGWILVEQGKVAEGLGVLEAAVQVAPAHPEIQYHYAVALARAGRKQESATVLRRLLDEARAFPARREAEALLKTLNQG